MGTREARTRAQIRDEAESARNWLFHLAEDLETGEYHSRELLYYPIVDAGLAGDPMWQSDPKWATAQVLEQIENASAPQLAAYRAYAEVLLEM